MMPSQKSMLRYSFCSINGFNSSNVSLRSNRDDYKSNRLRCMLSNSNSNSNSGT